MEEPLNFYVFDLVCCFWQTVFEDCLLDVVQVLSNSTEALQAGFGLMVVCELVVEQAQLTAGIAHLFFQSTAVGCLSDDKAGFVMKALKIIAKLLCLANPPIDVRGSFLAETLDLFL